MSSIIANKTVQNHFISSFFFKIHSSAYKQNLQMRNNDLYKRYGRTTGRILKSKNHSNSGCRHTPFLNQINQSFSSYSFD